MLNSIMQVNGELLRRPDGKSGTMATQWQMLMKEAFLQDLGKLQPKDTHQIIAKVNTLVHNPLPDGDVKKQLIYHPGKPYRIRSGDYRILYNFDDANVCVYRIERRNENTYKQNLMTAPIEGLDNEFDDVRAFSEAPTGDAWYQEEWFKPRDTSRLLPEPITSELLNKLHVPKGYHQRLLAAKTEQELYNCEGQVDDAVILQLIHELFETPLEQAMQQPNLVLKEVDDLLRYKEGELLTFLLHLSPEQEKYAHWPMNASGPTFVKGGPGTGKSTVALYRIRSLLEQLTKTNKAPRILFTTYTKALIKSSEQLLQQLLGNQAQYVRVDTVDKLARELLHHAGQVKDILSEREQFALIKQAVDETPKTGSPLQQLAQKQTLERMGYEYLLQEFNTVIIARQLNSVDNYQKASRNGRKVRLNANQRAMLWKIYERFCALQEASGKETWQQRRAHAERIVEQSPLAQSYDVVVIDEAQDLDPSAIRLLIKLCKAPNRIFVTADANQSIYGSGFSWQDVHACLKFQGRTSILRANYRSTQEIGEAAQSYLTYGALEPEQIERQYIHSGPMPDARSVHNAYYEAQLLASFFRKAARSFRLTLGSCALLCPSEHAGKTLAQALSDQGLEATFMTGDDLNLTRSGIKVLVLHSSKGLEFPIVALAGFVGSSYPYFPSSASEEAQREILARERRTMFVGMTRAMRALLVITPTDPGTSLFEGFDATYWNFTRKI
ncbi:UvrD-helicase domain-containing protein [Ktedonospora formicarum]|uniref:DNA 3'-5' helicase n=1 Tax=Ktedonospora formicarum TaxID=2778364 RepID=A0A8J3IE47_9CHLR|nr:UvrD-helicase domain-containing protein [Ktedonospora formicarum]GHO49629.1 DNA helicase [Ktedonospora formicarum]